MPEAYFARYQVIGLPSLQVISSRLLRAFGTLSALTYCLPIDAVEKMSMVANPVLADPRWSPPVYVQKRARQIGTSLLRFHEQSERETGVDIGEHKEVPSNG